MLTIGDYKKVNFLDSFGQKGKIYEVVKNKQKYFMYEFPSFGQVDVYNFKALQKLKTTHVLGLIQQITEGTTNYIITQYAEKDLLKLQTNQPMSVFALPVALGYFVQVILALEEFHDSRLAYRNIRPQIIKVKGDKLFFYDFTLSQFCKRKQRMFDLLGCLPFLAPEFYSEDGYGFEVDIWAAGVLLFFMLTNEYPLKIKSKGEKQIFQQMKTSLQGGFSFEKRLTTCKNPGFIKSNNHLQTFFKKILEFDYAQRITIKQIKSHKLMSGYFEAKIDPDLLQVIGDQGSVIQSALISKKLDLRKMKFWIYLEKQQLILDFIQKCSESLMLDCLNYIPESAIYRAQFSILKVAMIKITNLIDMCYGIKKPDFSYDSQQFEELKAVAAWKKVVHNLQNKKKMYNTLYRTAYLNLEKKQNNNSFYNQQITQDFNSIKISYRESLSQIFEILKIAMSKNKLSKPLFRKFTEVMSRMVIMHLINRIFEEQDFSKNFQLYIRWNKKLSIDNLDNWIHAEKRANLKLFIKDVTTHYL